MQTLRIFISSPGDVAEERQIAGKVIERLQGKYWSFVRLDDVFWEQKVVRSTAHYQDELISPGDCEMVVGILWSRLGSPLPDKFRKQTGERYQSGTEWELEIAFEAYEKNLALTGDPVAANPDIIIYRRRAARPVHEDEATDVKAAEQARKLDAYLKENYWFPDGTIKRPITGYKSLDEFEKKLSLHLEQLILRHIPSLKPGFEPPPISGSPFKGLRAFDFIDSDRYFGRNREIREIQQQLIASARKGLPFLLIYGGSGYGKSSLMRAGLAPVLTRPGGSLDEIHCWRRVPIQPAKGNGALIERLARSLLQAPTPEEAEQSRAHKHWPLTGLSELSGASIDGTAWDAAALTRHFSDDERRAFAIAAIVQTLESLNRHLLLEIDQLEELFTTPEFDETQCAAFLKTIGELTATGRVWTVATMRSEFFPRVAEQPELFHLVGKDRGYILPPPDRQSLREIIRYPALAARLDFERRIQDIEIAGEKAKHDYLHDQILADAESSPDALPLLEFTLQQLYEERRGDYLTWESYSGVSGLKGAIAKRATEIYQKLPAQAQQASHRVFATLVHIDPNRGAVTRQRAPLKSLLSQPDTKNFLNSFLEAHLLVTDEEIESNEPVVTLAHEALVTHWDDLAQWIASHRGDLLARQRLTENTNLWANSGRKKSLLLSEARLAEAQNVVDSGLFHLSEPEISFVKESRIRSRTKQKLLWTAIILFALLALGSTILAKVAEDQRRVANNEKLRAIAAESEARNSLARLNKNITFLEYDVRNALLNHAPLGVRDPILNHLKELSSESSKINDEDLQSKLNILSLEIIQQLDKGLIPENSDEIIQKIQSITLKLSEGDLNRADIYLICGNQINIAQLYYNLKDRKRQLEFLESAHMFAQKIIDTELSPREVDLIFNLYKFYSVYYRSVGDNISARKYVDNAFQLVRKNYNILGNIARIEMESTLLYEISCIDLEDGNDKSAMDNCESAYKLDLQLIHLDSMNIQYNEDIARTCEQMAKLHVKNRDFIVASDIYQKSARYYLNAATIDRSRKQLFNLCVISANSALVYLNFQPERERLIDIEEIVKEATNNFDEYILIPQVRLNACIVFYSLASVYSTLYDKEKLKEGEVEHALFLLRNSEFGLKEITNSTDKNFQEENNVNELIESLKNLEKSLSKKID